MARKRIKRQGNRIADETPLRRLFEENNQCAMQVRIHLQRMESQGKPIKL